MTLTSNSIFDKETFMLDNIHSKIFRIYNLPRKSSNFKIYVHYKIHPQRIFTKKGNILANLMWWPSLGQYLTEATHSIDMVPNLGQTFADIWILTLETDWSKIILWIQNLVKQTINKDADIGQTLLFLLFIYHLMSWLKGSTWHSQKKSWFF